MTTTPRTTLLGEPYSAYIHRDVPDDPHSLDQKPRLDPLGDFDDSIFADRDLGAEAVDDVGPLGLGDGQH